MEGGPALRRFNCIILGAAGRDFHDFQTFFRTHPEFRVCCFTAEQIPFIERRSFPRELAGESYDADIPIHAETALPDLIERYEADFVFLAYSDLAHEEVMHKASIAQAAGASFALLGPRHTQLRSKHPVIAVTAVRTGAGKSPLAQAIAFHLVAEKHRIGILRHPMPYGDLRRQEVQRFATFEDLERHECTVEEREEYEPYVERGLVIYAGVDYAAILAAAEAESDVILWDGGNNDFSFIEAGLHFVVLDALRPGDELDHYPGETNFRSADVLVINKVGAAEPASIERLRQHAAHHNPRARIIEADLVIEVDAPELVKGRRVLVVEDGPTLTHGGMSFGAGTLAARRLGARELLDPRPHATGSIAEAFRQYPHLGAVLPALGYSASQRRELAATIRATAPEAVVDASPARLDRILDLDQPLVRVRYHFEQTAGPQIEDLVDAFLESGSSPRSSQATRKST
ncbi:MAG: GTPase [Deltaproteobacteria bacterium]|nr:GTPase [Deltaproteobacteria bacterium]